MSTEQQTVENWHHGPGVTQREPVCFPSKDGERTGGKHVRCQLAFVWSPAAARCYFAPYLLGVSVLQHTAFHGRTHVYAHAPPTPPPRPGPAPGPAHAPAHAPARAFSRGPRGVPRRRGCVCACWRPVSFRVGRVRPWTRLAPGRGAGAGWRRLPGRGGVPALQQGPPRGPRLGRAAPSVLTETRPSLSQKRRTAIRRTHEHETAELRHNRNPLPTRVPEPRAAEKPRRGSKELWQPRP